MKFKKSLCFLFFLFLFILVLNMHLNGEVLVYTYDDIEYTFTYEDASDAATKANFRFDETEGIIYFSNMEIEIAYDDKAYKIYANQENNTFYLSSLSDVEEFYNHKETAINIINDDNLYNIEEEREMIIAEIADIYYDVNMSLDDNKYIITSMYSSFLANVMMAKKSIFSDLTRADLETIKTLIYATYDLNENGLDPLFVSDIGYDKAEDYIEDVNYKIMFDENRDYILKELENKIRYHDPEQIYEIIDDAKSSMDMLEYYPNSDDMYALFASLSNLLNNIQVSYEENILLFQEKNRFHNYFSVFSENIKQNQIYDEDGVNQIINHIIEYSSYVDNANNYLELIEYKNELMELINDVPIKQIESEKGKVSVDGSLSSDATLTITDAENKGNSEKAYDISINASNASNDNVYNIEIYDVDLRYTDIEVYRIYNGEKVKLHSEYANNCLSVQTDTLGTIYVERRLNAPWGQMAIVFGILFALLISTIIFFNIDGKKDERRI